jgi:hypothetical protein
MMVHAESGTQGPSMTANPASLLYNILERCSRTPHGYVIDPEDHVVGLLIQEGLLAVVDDGAAAVTTPKGKELLQQLGHTPRRGKYPYDTV